MPELITLRDEDIEQEPQRDPMQLLHQQDYDPRMLQLLQLQQQMPLPQMQPGGSIYFPEGVPAGAQNITFSPQTFTTGGTGQQNMGNPLSGALGGLSGMLGGLGGIFK